MKLLIQLRTDSELASYEGCALALTLATFGHEVQLYLDAPVFGLLMQPKSRLQGMIQALELYDMPAAWLPNDVFSGWLTGMLPKDLAAQLTLVPEVINTQDFEQILTF
jgi:tRNA 2-thiouridine synthesizing protein C